MGDAVPPGREPRIVILAPTRLEMRWAPPARKPAGSIPIARNTKNNAPICQAWCARIDCVVIGIINVPSEPPADTIPNTLLRLFSDTARAQAVITSEDAVHDNAMPTSTPETIRPEAPRAMAMTANPPIYVAARG